VTLWLRVRRAPACAATILAVAVALIPTRTLFLPLPALLTGFGLNVPFSLLLPIAVAIVVAWGLTTGDPLAEAVSSRPLRLWDTAYAVTAATLALGACAVAWALSETNLALGAGRNAVGYVGLALIGRRLLGSQAAAMLPAAFVVGSALFGGGAGGPDWWAWPLVDADQLPSWVVAVALLALGAVVAMLRTDPTATE